MRVSTREADVLNACLSYLRLKGIFCWRQNTSGIRRRTTAGREFWAAPETKGISDILGVLHDGRMLAIEAKGPQGKLTREQTYFLDAVRNRGGVAACVRSVAELETAIRAAGAFPIPAG